MPELIFVGFGEQAELARSQVRDFLHAQLVSVRETCLEDCNNVLCRKLLDKLRTEVENIIMEAVFTVLPESSTKDFGNNRSPYIRVESTNEHESSFIIDCLAKMDECPDLVEAPLIRRFVPKK
jgi:hypothetical protein